jgi:DtxR family Mn-dependent transcriptional regulator
MNTKPTHTVEDYLMRMIVMERDHGEIVAARLAELLNVAPPTVAMTLRRMERDGFVVGRGRKSMQLTELGKTLARGVTRRHMLIEWLLIKVFNVPLPQVHDEAHGLEHAITPLLESKMEEILGDPKVCPHGNPMPGCDEFVSGWRSLVSVQPGSVVTIRRIHEHAEDNHELLKYLIEKNLLPGSLVKVLSVLPFNQTCSIEANGQVETLGLVTAGFIFVE